MFKLKRVNAAFKIRAAGGVLLVLVLTGCPSRPPRETAPPAVPVPRQPAVPHEGLPFRIVQDESLLTVLVYRGGALARLGHNHVVASHALMGTAFVPQDLTHSSFEVHVPVNELAVDEPDLRSLEGPDFPRDVPDSAKQGTRNNMLGAALLDAEHYPEITLQSERIERTPEGLQAQVRVTVRDQMRVFGVPLRYEQSGNELKVAGELALKQTELGLTPFTAAGGALHVLDEIKVKFRIVARSGEPGP